jgi:hypothetical protein
MGAGQTFQWATSYPDFMDICVPFCGSAKTSEHNQVMLEGVKSALVAAAGGRSLGSCGDAVSGGKESGVRSWGKEERETGLKAFARVYAGWGFSQVSFAFIVILT